MWLLNIIYFIISLICGVEIFMISFCCDRLKSNVVVCIFFYLECFECEYFLSKCVWVSKYWIVNCVKEFFLIYNYVEDGKFLMFLDNFIRYNSGEW